MNRDYYHHTSLIKRHKINQMRNIKGSGTVLPTVLWTALTQIRNVQIKIKEKRDYSILFKKYPLGLTFIVLD